ncbi:MAG TPA: endonuclease [Bacteroidia bacterium]|nr:endonuclease [Bacteroidia bacterium]
MKLFLTCILSVWIVSQKSADAQAIQVNLQQLNFGIAYENAPDSLPLTIQNLLNRTVTVTGLRFYSTYGSPAFSSPSTSFSIAAGSSTVMWVRFSPYHNILHNSEMVIENDGLRGTVSVDLTGQGRFSNTYYNSTENTEEESLKSAIHTLTGNNYVSLGYNTARDKMFMTIDNEAVNGQGASQNTLESVYTGQQAIGYTDRTDCQNRFNFNTEHTWPQSLFSSNEPMVSDLHHLFPTDDNSNGERGNNPFGVVNNPSWSVGGSKSNNVIFEPRDAQKGRTARAMIYFLLRYQNYSSFFTSQENILRTWHNNFPPTFIDKKRNDDIQAFQHNRNPFVDYPQFLDRITFLSGTSVAPVVRTIDLPEDTILYGSIPVGSPTVFHYVVVNNGNADVNLSNFGLDHPAELSFQSGGTNTTLAPGEALGIDISCLPSTSGSLRGHLTFLTTATNHSSVTVPIFANDSVFTQVDEASPRHILVYPNPVQHDLSVDFGEGDAGLHAIHLFDCFGRELMSATGISGSRFLLNMDAFATGNYLLRIESIQTGGVEYRNILKY